MRIVFFSISLLITVFLLFALGGTTFTPLALGNFLSPQHGIWQNAEPVGQGFDDELNFTGLKGNATVYIDERLVPHIVADNDEDACFIQGYLHAKFRLWQMEFQTHAAAGRISEIVGDAALNYDRGKRRTGIVYAAQNMLREIEANPITKTEVDNYTAGVNAYIATLTESRLPVEYKLLGYAPEKWNNLKTALFVKQMTETLAGFEDDLPMTKALAFFGDTKLKLLFPQIADSLDPVIPKGTVYPQATVHPVPPASKDSLYIQPDSLLLKGSIKEMKKPNPANGSNNWAVSGTKTQSGAPILCNDPHLTLSLPSIWYEMQMITPTMNAYGVSFAGAPGIIIGFNDSIAFGFTNSGRDVKDYYTIRFKDETKAQYKFDNDWKNSDIRIEEIKVKGRPSVYDTVAYTVFGPVVYDHSFPASAAPGEALAARWKAHDPSNELLFWHYLDRANNYADYENALQYFSCPAQNVVFASKSGDIALWQQGTFPARWNRQGVYIMPGEDSSYLWQSFIPRSENPHILNPARGFVSSANQRPADSAYHYFIPGYYDVYRGIEINRRLEAMSDITPGDMMKLQMNNYNAFAETARPLLLKYIVQSSLEGAAYKYYDTVKNWSLNNDINLAAPTIFSLWFQSLENLVWNDEFEKAGVEKMRPAQPVLAEALLRDSAFEYIDNINTPQVETIADIIAAAFKQAATTADSLSAQNILSWGAYKNTSIFHLLKTQAMPFARTGLMIGGGRHVINATQHDHGPSWRMIVHLTGDTEAYVVYPGGQSGNPGSPYYDNFVDKWTTGEYYKAWVMKNGEEGSDRLVWKMYFRKG